MDLYSYTQLSLAGYLLSGGIKKRRINDVEAIDDFVVVCDSQRPSVAPINEDCFIHDASNSQRVKLTINQHPSTLFIVSMAITNAHFDKYLLVRENLLISSKSIRPESLDDIPGGVLKKETTITSFLDMPALSSSRTESSMLQMWTASQGTIQISDQMNAETKTVSSRKGNIKRKIRTHDKQVIYHVVRLTDDVTNDILVSIC